VDFQPALHRLAEVAKRSYRNAMELVRKGVRVFPATSIGQLGRKLSLYEIRKQLHSPLFLHRAGSGYKLVSRRSRLRGIACKS